jgi:hypothetical protein
LTLAHFKTHFKTLRAFRTATTNFTYLIQSSTNLVNWTPTALLLNTNGSVQFTDSAVTNSRARFYRATMP